MTKEATLAFPGEEHADADRKARRRADTAAEAMARQLALIRERLARGPGFQVGAGSASGLADQAQRLSALLAELDTLHDVREWHADGRARQVAYLVARPALLHGMAGDQRLEHDPSLPPADRDGDLAGRILDCLGNATGPGRAVPAGGSEVRVVRMQQDARRANALSAAEFLHEQSGRVATALREGDMTTAGFLVAGLPETARALQAGVHQREAVDDTLELLGLREAGGGQGQEGTSRA